MDRYFGDRGRAGPTEFFRAYGIGHADSLFQAFAQPISQLEYPLFLAFYAAKKLYLKHSGKGPAPDGVVIDTATPEMKVAEQQFKPPVKQDLLSQLMNIKPKE